jgi:hypothetical protein
MKDCSTFTRDFVTTKDMEENVTRGSKMKFV